MKNIWIYDAPFEMLAFSNPKKAYNKFISYPPVDNPPAYSTFLKQIRHEGVFYHSDSICDDHRVYKKEVL